MVLSHSDTHTHAHAQSLLALNKRADLPPGLTVPQQKGRYFIKNNTCFRANHPQNEQGFFQ